jgi:hypothetical protein
MMETNNKKIDKFYETNDAELNKKIADYVDNTGGGDKLEEMCCCGGLCPGHKVVNFETCEFICEDADLEYIKKLD